MLARAGRAAAATRTQCGFEVKWDGIRTVAFCDHGHIDAAGPQLHATSRRATRRCASSPATLGARRVVLDGEIVAFDDEGRPSFERLQSRMHLASDSAVRRRMRDTPVTYVIFDLLYLDGHSTMPLAYEERRELLERARAGGAGLARAGLPPRRGRAPCSRPRASSASRASSPSGSTARTSPARAPRPGSRSRTSATQDVVIGGWTPGEGGRSAQPRRARRRRDGGRRAALRRQGRHRLHRADARARCSASSSRCARDTLAVRAAASRRRARSSWSRGWSRASSSASGRAAERCARPPSRACGRTTWTRRIAFARKVRVRLTG